MITIENLKKNYGDRLVIDVERLEMLPRQTTVVIGPSGCGKSTLLRLVMYLTRPNSGTIRINGQVVDDSTCRPLRHKMGYVIQEGGLFPHLTAEENVTLMAKRLGWERTRIKQRLEELCHLVGLDAELLGRYPLQLSGGQRQRVSLMRALMLDPPLLLMDEPLGALDPMIRIRLQSDLKRIFERLNKTVVFVTHDMAEAAFFSNEIALMKDGHIVQKGTIQKLVKEPASSFVTEFIQAQRPPEKLFVN